VAEFVIGLGSNLGAPRTNLVHGATLLHTDPTLHVHALSRVFETAPVGPPQPRYLNAAVRLTSSLGPEQLLAKLLAVEQTLGRVRDVRWGPRTLDLDLLWAEQPFTSMTLEVPHPRLRERAFALAPLLDVAPELGAEYEAQLEALGGVPAVVGRLVFESGAIGLVLADAV
jgi:2-amino-4-hydroxy-6-hydroxymethyldihydropteridine diphosphokinase